MRKNIIPSNTNNIHSLKSEDKIIASLRSYIFPPPEEMEKYERINPGTFKTLVDTYKNQNEHRISLEKEVIESDIKNARYGQIFGFIITIITIIGGFTLIILGKNVYGLVAIIGALATLISIFIGNFTNRKKDLDKKANENPENTF